MDDIVDQVIVVKNIADLVDDKVFDPSLANRLHVATRVLLRADAFVIMIHLFGTACAGFANHRGFTLAAEQFCGENIIVCHLMPGGSLFLRSLSVV